VMMIGHNPGIAEFAQRLVTQAPLNVEFQRFPTGATLVVDFTFTSWDEAAYGSGISLDFIVPRELAL
jgi:phosphohistidine phosphatase